MKTKLFGLILAGLVLIGGAAQAAVLSVTGGDATQTLGAAFSLNATTGLSAGSPITVFNAGNAGSGGLSVAGSPGKLTFEFLGSEAGFIDAFYVNSVLTFLNTVTPVGATSTVFQGPGLINLVATTSGGGIPGSAANGGPITGALSLAYAAITDTSLILLFEDGAGVDHDDLAVRVTVSQVPLPAAAWLLISAVLGLVSFARIRRSGTQTA
jgi:hypothetical protein